MSNATTPDLQPLTQPAPAPISSPQWQMWGIGQLVDCLGVCECRRRLLHMLPGLLPAILWLIPHQDPWALPLIATTLVFSLGVTIVAIVRAADFARPQECLWYQSVLGYLLPILAMLLLLPGQAELGLLTLGIVAFGDGSAALGGKLLGGRRLPWNHHKTWSGLVCFIVAGTTAASLSYWSEARPAVPFHIALSIAAAAAIVGAIVESLPIRSHDNFRVGATAALTGLTMHLLLLGW